MVKGESCNHYEGESSLDITLLSNHVNVMVVDAILRISLFLQQFRNKAYSVF